MYNISKKQLKVVLLGAVILEWYFLAEATSNYSSNELAGFGSVLLPFVVAFYILGWKDNEKKKGENPELFKMEKIVKIMPSFKKILFFLIGAVTVLVIFLFAVLSMFYWL